MPRDINRTMFWLFTMIFGAALVWALVFSVHHARAADEEEGPKWKIVVTVDAPDGKHSLVYGQWYQDRAACEKAKKSDERLNHGLALLKQQLKQMRQQVELTVECKPDNSV